MIRDPGWRKASVLLCGLACLAAVVAAVFLAVRVVRDPATTIQPVGTALLATGVCFSGLALSSRHRWWSYRVLLLVSTASLATLASLGGLFLGIYFLPAALFASLALGTEAFSKRSGIGNFTKT